MGHDKFGGRKAPCQGGLDGLLRNLDFVYTDGQQKDFKINSNTMTSVMLIRKVILAASKGPSKETGNL